MKYGFVKVAAAIPHVKVADCNFNACEIEREIINAEDAGVEIAVFPELCICSGRTYCSKERKWA